LVWTIYLTDLKEEKRELRPNQIKDGNYWEYVLAYDRFDYFPNSTLGYFFDAGQIFANTKGLPSFEGSVLHKFLQGINSSKPEIKIKEIVSYLRQKNKGRNTFRKQLKRTTTVSYNPTLFDVKGRNPKSGRHQNHKSL
jgi:hypothetical protein